jgi:hypothetical protein
MTVNGRLRNEKLLSLGSSLHIPWTCIYLSI